MTAKPTLSDQPIPPSPAVSLTPKAPTDPLSLLERWGARLVLAAPGLALIAGPNMLGVTSFTNTSYDHHRVTFLGFLLLIFGLLLAFPGIRRTTGAVWDQIPAAAKAGMGTFFIFGLVSALRTPHPEAALLEWGTFLSGTGSVLAVAGARRYLGREGDIWLITMPMAGMVIYLGDFFAAYLPFALDPYLQMEWVSPFFHFENVRFFNQIQSWTLPLFAGAILLAGSVSRPLQGLLVLFGGFFWAMLFATGGRGTLLATALSTLVVMLIFRDQSKRWALSTLGLAGLGGVIFLIIFQSQGAAPGPDRAVEASGGLDSSRIQLWRDAASLALHHPLFGIGPMQLAQGSQFGNHPHNALLQILSEWGLPGTIGGLVVAVYGILAWARYWRKHTAATSQPAPVWNAAVPPAITASLFAGLAHAMVSGIIVMPISQVFILLITGWILGIFQCGREASPPFFHGTSWKGLFVVSAMALGIGAIQPGFLGTLPRIQNTYQAVEFQGLERVRPRFWGQGNICMTPWPESRADGFCSSPAKSVEGKR